MCQLTFNVPDTTPEVLDVPAELLGAEILLAAAVKLHEAGRLSSGAAAELAGVPKPVFVERLATFGVPAFRQSGAELSEEAGNA